ncbi:MAG: bifunctional UDP-sugar hydrolase/5'-nucleotidase [Marinifilaceae bacterium]
MSSRRSFIRKVGLGGFLLGLGGIPVKASEKKGMQKITILHTNDMHSHIDPFPKSDPKYGGLGGFARLNNLVRKIRKEEEQVLLFDAGDVFQGTPYFNFYKGEAEYRLMTQMGYDAGTIGNHEFDNGLEGILAQLPNAGFPLINANYDFSETILAGKIEPYRIFDKGGVKIGVFGVGVGLEGLVDTKNYGKTIYKDPIKVANDVAVELREKHGCELVICLSHLGYKHSDGSVCDVELAGKSKGIDLIVGGHSHTMLETADRVRDLDGREVLVNQVGWAGIALGRIDFYVDSESSTRLASSSIYSVNNDLV